MNSVQRTSEALKLLADFQGKLAEIGFLVTNQNVVMRHWGKQVVAVGKIMSPDDFAPATLEMTMTAREKE